MIEAGSEVAASNGASNDDVASTADEELIGQLLFEDASRATRPTTLWSTVAEQADSKRHNGQMDVVLALWQAGLLRTA